MAAGAGVVELDPEQPVEEHEPSEVGPGRIERAAGDPELVLYLRSSAKPLQAIPLAAAYDDLDDRELAIASASHLALPDQLAAVEMLLARARASEDDLECGPAGTPPRRINHNCSGKHAGFLAWCRLRDEPSDTYLDPDHPLQRAVRRTLAGLLDCSERELVAGTDGCGAPNYALPLAQLARAYAQLAAPAGDSGVAADLHTLFAAMTAHPEMVSGERRDDLVLMQAAPGDWVAKGGAEGVQALGVASRGIGIAASYYGVGLGAMGKHLNGAGASVIVAPPRPSHRTPGCPDA